MNPPSLEDQISEIKNQFYSENSKSSIFKQKQKSECASVITNKIPLEELLQKTIYIGKDNNGLETNEIFMNYLLIKTFATSAIFEEIIDYTMSIIGKCLNKHGIFIINVNMKSFSATALQKYKPVIESFLKRCLNDDIRYSENLQILRIYNPPSMMATIFKIFTGFVHPTVWSKIQIQSSDTEWIW